MNYAKIRAAIVFRLYSTSNKYISYCLLPKMFEKLSRLIQKKPFAVVAIIALITIIFGALIPGIEMAPFDVESFTPDDDITAAQFEIMDKFGKMPVSVIILVEKDRESAVSPPALRAQFNFTKQIYEAPAGLSFMKTPSKSGAVPKVEYVENVLSVVSFINSFTQILYGQSLSECNDAQIELVYNSLKTGDFSGLMRSMPPEKLSEFVNSGIDMSEMQTIGAKMRETLKMLVTPDEDATIIIINLDPDITPPILIDISKEIVHIMENSRSESVKFSASGTGIMANEVNELTKDSNKIIAISIFIIIAGILLISFKKFSYVIISLGGLLIAIIWLFGTMALVGLDFNIMYMAFIPLLMGLGVDFSVHLFHNYRSELRKGNDPAQAIVASIRDVGTAMFLATITTAISFLTFLTANIPPIRFFGVLSALGIVYAFIITITLQTGVMYLLDKNRSPDQAFYGKKHKTRKKEGTLFLLDIAMERSAHLVSKHSKKVLCVVGVVTILMVLGAGNISTTFNLEEFFPEGVESIQTLEKIQQEFPFAGMNDQDYILLKGQDLTTPEVMAGIAATLKNAENDKLVLKEDGIPIVKSPLSIANAALSLDKGLTTKLGISTLAISEMDHNELKTLFDHLYANVTYGKDLKTVLHRDDVGNYDAALIRIHSNLMSAGRAGADLAADMKILSEEMNGDLSYYGEEVEGIVTGPHILMHSVTSAMTASQIRSTIICLLISAIVAMIAFRNVILGLITLVPVGLAISWIMGTMYLLGYSLNIMTITVTTLTIGLGIAYAIHVIQRFRLVADRTGDAMEATMEAVKHSGGALFLAGITTIAGFGILVISPMPPMKEFGIILATTIFYSFMSAIYILPILLMYWGEYRKRKNGWIISSQSANKR
ncbi:MAG: bifunctional preprotein translocase subunit SecD/SecF [Candidatus Methanolliviera sp. GoM_oil]|nr:MAG: bifunctional preprotein translocase subunit SecD/SecF [Candidatus Methanolliviera sp. GoM_oil]